MELASFVTPLDSSSLDDPLSGQFSPVWFRLWSSGVIRVCFIYKPLLSPTPLNCFPPQGNAQLVGNCQQMTPVATKLLAPQSSHQIARKTAHLFQPSNFCCKDNLHWFITRFITLKWQPTECRELILGSGWLISGDLSILERELKGIREMANTLLLCHQPS